MPLSCLGISAVVGLGGIGICACEDDVGREEPYDVYDAAETTEMPDMPDIPDIAEAPEKFLEVREDPTGDEEG